MVMTNRADLIGIFDWIASAGEERFRAAYPAGAMMFTS
jgi:hypothetical protein